MRIIALLAVLALGSCQAEPAPVPQGPQPTPYGELRDRSDLSLEEAGWLEVTGNSQYEIWRRVDKTGEWWVGISRGGRLNAVRIPNEED